MNGWLVLLSFFSDAFFIVVELYFIRPEFKFIFHYFSIRGEGFKVFGLSFRLHGHFAWHGFSWLNQHVLGDVNTLAPLQPKVGPPTEGHKDERLPRLACFHTAS